MISRSVGGEPFGVRHRGLPGKSIEMFKPDGRAGAAGEVSWISPRRCLYFEGSGRHIRCAGPWSIQGRRTSIGD